MTQSISKHKVILSSTINDQDLKRLHAIVQQPRSDPWGRSSHALTSTSKDSIVTVTSVATTLANEAVDMDDIEKEDSRRSSYKTQYSTKTKYDSETESDESWGERRGYESQASSTRHSNETDSDRQISRSDKGSRPCRQDVPSRRSSMASRHSSYSSRRIPSYQNPGHFQSLDSTMSRIISERETSFSSTNIPFQPDPVSPIPETSPPQRRIKLERSLSLPPPLSHTTLISTLPPRYANSSASQSHPSSRRNSTSKSRPSSPRHPPVLHHSSSFSPSPSHQQTHSLSPTARPSLSNSTTASPNTLPLPPVTTPVILDWTSPSTRRHEYAKIDSSHSGLRGLWKRVMPKCMHHKRARRGFWDEKRASDEDSVRRYRVGSCDDDDGGDSDEGGGGD